MEQMRFHTKTPIQRGWSGDQKYEVTTEDGTRYFLRAAPPEKKANMEVLYHRMQEAAKLGIPMSRPVAFGRCDRGTYLLQTWVDGEDAEQVIPRLGMSEQRAYGLQAGEALKRIHSISAPSGQRPWAERMNAKIDRNISWYRACPLSFEGAEEMIAYIEQNRHLLKGRPQTFQHGDYHIGNMMLEKGQLVIIDFDRFDFGDPWEEFNRIPWCAQVSPAFATGMVDGYFGGMAPMEFWRLLALYISSNMLSSLPWAIPFGEEQIQTMRRQAAEVLCWYDNMRHIIPTWYMS